MFARRCRRLGPWSPRKTLASSPLTIPSWPRPGRSFGFPPGGSPPGTGRTPTGPRLHLGRQGAFPTDGHGRGPAMKWVLYNLTTTTQGGGVEMSVWSLGKELALRGHEVTIIGGQSRRPLPAEAAGLQVLTFGFTPRERFVDLGTRARKLMERLSFARQALPGLRGGGFERLLIFKSYDLAPALWAARREHAGGLFERWQRVLPWLRTVGTTLGLPGSGQHLHRRTDKARLLFAMPGKSPGGEHGLLWPGGPRPGVGPFLRPSPRRASPGDGGALGGLERCAAGHKRFGPAQGQLPPSQALGGWRGALSPGTGALRPEGWGWQPGVSIGFFASDPSGCLLRPGYRGAVP
ncbi:hypothetical protein DFAR_3610017 [Desulfarculales bacterium]